MLEYVVYMRKYACMCTWWGVCARMWCVHAGCTLECGMFGEICLYVWYVCMVCVCCTCGICRSHFCLPYLPPYALRYEFTHWLGWLALELQGSACLELLPLCVGGTNGHSHTWLFCELGIQNRSSCLFFTNKPSPQTRESNLASLNCPAVFFSPFLFVHSSMPH